MRVVYLDGRESVLRILPVDRLGFEREFKQVWMGGSTDDIREEHFLWMAWTISKRDGLVSADFDTWVATVEDWFLDDAPKEESADTDAEDPTPTSTDPAPSTG